MSQRRFLKPGAGQGREALGYSSQPLRLAHDDEPEIRERIGEARSMFHEPEACSKEWVDAEAELAVTRNLERLRAAHEEAKVVRGNLSIESRLADVQRRARRRRIDQNLAHELNVIAKLVERGKDAGLRRLEHVEALLDGVLEAA